MFCIDDRCYSIRRYIERFSPDCQTYGTAGFFNIPFYFQPDHGKFMTKVCPAPVEPIHVIKESGAKIRHEKDAHFSKHSKGVFGAWFISQTMGFWSAIKIAKKKFRPGPTPAMVSSFNHMDPKGKLSIECIHPDQRHHGLQVGFTVEEMANSLEGLVNNFAPLVYVMGHGASSVNNTYKIGKEQLVIFLVTIIFTLATDLLIGIGVGILTKIIMHLSNGLPLKYIFKPLFTVTVTNDEEYIVDVFHSAVFSNYIKLKKSLDALPKGKKISIDFSNANLVDHTAMEKLHQYQHSYENDGGQFNINGMSHLQKVSDHDLSSRKTKKITVV